MHLIKNVGKVLQIIFKKKSYITQNEYNKEKRCYQYFADFYPPHQFERVFLKRIVVTRA